MNLATMILQNVLTSGLTSLLKGVGGPLGFLFSEGGMVPGSGNKDTVPAFLTPGEYVLPKHVVESIRAGQKPGSPGMFNSGGLVSAGAGAHTSINLVMQSASPPNTATLRRDIANGLAPVLDGLTRKRNYRTGARTGGRVT